MPDSADIRTDIKSVLDGLSNIGVVHDYERWAVNWASVLDILRDDDDSIRAWMIWCAGSTPVLYRYDEDSSRDAVLPTVRQYTFKLRGICALVDATESEKDFLVVVEQVMDALDTDATLHDGDKYWGDQTPACSLDVYEVRLFAGTLCHVGELTQMVTATVSV